MTPKTNAVGANRPLTKLEKQRERNRIRGYLKKQGVKSVHELVASPQNDFIKERYKATNPTPRDAQSIEPALPSTSESSFGKTSYSLEERISITEDFVKSHLSANKYLTKYPHLNVCKSTLNYWKINHLKSLGSALEKSSSREQSPTLRNESQGQGIRDQDSSPPPHTSTTPSQSLTPTDRKLNTTTPNSEATFTDQGTITRDHTPERTTCATPIAPPSLHIDNQISNVHTQNSNESTLSEMNNLQKSQIPIKDRKPFKKVEPFPYPKALCALEMWGQVYQVQYDNAQRDQVVRDNFLYFVARYQDEYKIFQEEFNSTITTTQMETIMKKLGFNSSPATAPPPTVTTESHNEQETPNPYPVEASMSHNIKDNKPEKSTKDQSRVDFENEAYKRYVDSLVLVERYTRLNKDIVVTDPRPHRTGMSNIFTSGLVEQSRTRIISDEQYEEHLKLLSIFVKAHKGDIDL